MSYRTSSTDWPITRGKLLFWLGLTVVVALSATFIPPGYDFANFYGLHIVERSAMPWTDGSLYVLSWPLLIGLTVTAQVMAVDRRKGSMWVALLAILSLPVMWTILIGQLEGLSLLGLTLMSWALPVRLLERPRPQRVWWLGLGVLVVTTLIVVVVVRVIQGENYFAVGVGGGPAIYTYRSSPLVGGTFGLMLLWVVPVVLLKPQLTIFGLLSKRSWTMAALGFFIVSLAAWGWWLPNMLARTSPELRAAQPQDIALFPWSLLIALPLLWLGRGDEDLLMAAGSFAVPSLHPYHFTVLMPALARLPLPWRILCWLCSFLPLTANYLGPQFWLTGNIFPLILWFGLWRQRRLKLRQPVGPNV